MVAREFEHRSVPDKIGVGIGTWICYRITHAGLRRQMQDYIESFSSSSRCQRPILRDVGFDKPECAALADFGQPALL